MWDDLGRKVAQTTPEGGTTIYVYDPAGNLTTKVEAQGDADEMTTTYTYDPLNRLTTEDTGDANCYTLGGAEIQYTYDSPTGCPSGTCVNSNGRLAYVKTQMWCDDSEPDDAFDQITYYGYDDAGRTTKEAIRDDGGRSADQGYGWNKNSRQTWIEYPGLTTYYSDYGTDSDSDNSNMDEIVDTKQPTFLGPNYITVNGTWFPFGPMKSYTQENTRNSHNIVARFQWDPAYRPQDLLYEESTGADLFHIDYSCDDAGRVTTRDFSSQQSGVQDGHFTYDFQGRVTCDSATSGTCPSSGSDLKSNIGGYDASNERTSITHQSANFPAETYSYTYVSGSHEIDHITKSDTHQVNFGWDGRGNRLYDDDDQWKDDDRRDYTYDGRNNLISVSGKMRVDATLGFTLHTYTETNAYDHKNRRIFKSVLDEDTSVESQWFFYYDLQDRLIYVKYTPNVSDSTTYNLFTFVWLGPRPVYYWELDYVSGSYTSAAERYLHADELNRPLEAWTLDRWNDGTTRVWALNPDAFGWDDVATGSELYQPLRFPGQYQDEETIARSPTSSSYPPTRPALSDNRYRVFDPFTSSYLQADPAVASTWSPYAYASNNPVTRADPSGLDYVDTGSSGDEGGDGEGCRGPLACIDWTDLWIFFNDTSWMNPAPGPAFPAGGGGGQGGGGSGSDESASVPPMRGDHCIPSIGTGTPFLNSADMRQFRGCGFLSAIEQTWAMPSVTSCVCLAKAFPTQRTDPWHTWHWCGGQMHHTQDNSGGIWQYGCLWSYEPKVFGQPLKEAPGPWQQVSVATGQL